MKGRNSDQLPRQLYRRSQQLVEMLGGLVYSSGNSPDPKTLLRLEHAVQELSAAVTEWNSKFWGEVDE